VREAFPVESDQIDSHVFERALLKTSRHSRRPRLHRNRSQPTSSTGSSRPSCSVIAWTGPTPHTLRWRSY
jgi:hypothetical protein